MPGERCCAEYRVEVIAWEGHAVGASHLEAKLNEFAGDDWPVVAILPTTAGTSIRSLMNVQAFADTTEFAVVLQRESDAPTRRRPADTTSTS